MCKRQESPIFKVLFIRQGKTMISLRCKSNTVSPKIAPDYFLKFSRHGAKAEHRQSSVTYARRADGDDSMRTRQLQFIGQSKRDTRDSQRVNPRDVHGFS